MEYIGTVRDGKVELPPEANLADGTVVRVELVENEVDPVYRLHDLAVDADLPADLAAQHDHYIYGTPKRKE